MDGNLRHERPGPGEPAMTAWAVGNTFPAGLSRGWRPPDWGRSHVWRWPGSVLLDCVTRANQAFSGPQFPLLHSERARVGATASTD